MKKLSFFALACSILFFFLAFNRPLPESDSVVGDVKYSLLNPEQFKRAMTEKYGEERANDWTLLNGSNITTTKLNDYYTKVNMPDARGIFIRGMNESRNDGLQNPETRGIGEFQRDTFRIHSHNVQDQGHHHGIRATLNTGTNVGASGAEATTLGGGGYFTGSASIKEDNIGGLETRPRNISLYIYVKVR